jgi:pimeloyl-ACP methyl ester carboxylesterase
VAGSVNRPKEQALLLGPHKSLVGILTAAASSSPAADARPMVVLLNAGIIHRVGPNRMHVELARSLAAAGHTVLRFDLSGIGDSEPRTDGLAPLDASLADIREVLDWLEAVRGAKRFILVGLCSGADQALLYAGDDPRVVGLALLDPSLPRTRGFYYRHWGRRLLSLRTWLSVASGRHPLWQRVLRRLGVGKAEEQGPVAAPDLDSLEVRKILEQAYLAVLRNGVRLLAVFAGTAGREYRINYKEQMLDAFPDVSFGDALQLEYFREADHTFSAERYRSELLGLIQGWIDAQFACGGEVVARA